MNREKAAVDVEVVIVVPQGSRHKYAMNHPSGGRIRFDRRLLTSSRYPAGYGFIPGTLAEDGNPLGTLVLTGYPVFPGSYMLTRPVAVFWLVGERGPDATILTVPFHDPRFSGLRDMPDIPPGITAGIRRFFGVPAGLDPGTCPDASGWQDRLAAERVIEAAFTRTRGIPDIRTAEVGRFGMGVGARRAAMRDGDELRASGTAAAAGFRPSIGGWVIRVVLGGIRQRDPGPDPRSHASGDRAAAPISSLRGGRRRVPG
jgi:inorganic pyrophosphatase